MRFPLYWKTARNESGTLTARGWSDVSEAQAQQAAQNRLERIVQFLRRLKSGSDSDLDRYHYVIDDCICEFVIDRIKDDSGNEIGVISRNAYGALILNASNVMLIDIDIPPDSDTKPSGLIGRFLRRKSMSADERVAQAVEKFRTWQHQHPDFSFRVYRTRGGLRAVVINKIFEEVSSAVIAIMEQLDSDPLYRELCKSQKCFRARLTPKPWRIGKSLPEQKFPFESDEQEAAFQKWFDDYISRSSRWSVCHFLETIGPQDYHRAALTIVELHDRFCCSDQRKELA